MTCPATGGRASAGSAGMPDFDAFYLEQAANFLEDIATDEDKREIAGIIQRLRIDPSPMT